MDRSTSRYALLAIFALVACEQKSPEVVFTDDKATNSCAGKAIPNQYIVHYLDGTHTVEQTTSREDFKSGFVTQNLQRIKYIEPDRSFDFHTDGAHELIAEGSSSGGQWGLSMINAEAAWSKNIYGDKVTVAVLDTEVDTQHQQLQSRVAINEAEIPDNGIDDDQNGTVDDYAGAVFISKSDNYNSPMPDHGSHVAGIIVADPEFGPVSGVAPHAKILPAQFLSRTGSGLLSDALRAIDYVSKRNVQVLNASWGGSPCVKSLRDSLQKLSDKGVLLVVAAGNSGQDLERSPEYPAAFNLPNQLTIAASTDLDFMPSWSNNSFKLVHVAAPGDGILSTFVGNRTGTMSGTSMATPFVAGVAALLKSAYPQASPAQIKNAIMNSVDVRPGHEFKVLTHGRINVEKALSALRSETPASTNLTSP